VCWCWVMVGFGAFGARWGDGVGFRFVFDVFVLSVVMV
jgi:hypothetical protein